MSCTRVGPLCYGCQNHVRQEHETPRAENPNNLHKCVQLLRLRIVYLGR